MDSIKQTTIEENEEGILKSKGVKTIQDKRRNKMTVIDITDEVKEMQYNKNKSGEEQKTSSLPKNVTMKPQDEEHMDLSIIKEKDLTPVVDVYLPVSDDDGGLLGNKELEKKAKKYCDLYESSKKEKIENPDQLLKELKDFSLQYDRQVNKTSGITIGIDTKYRIRLGKLFNFQKKLVRMTKHNWIEWFSDNYGSTYLRSIQDYMALAKIPNVIRYAFLGKERLMEIKRVIPSISGDDDPIETFLKDFQISLDFQADSSIDDLKRDIDAVLAIAKIKEVEKNKEIEIDVNADKIKNLTSMGIKVDKGLIHDLVIIKENGGDVNQYLEHKFINGGAEDAIIVSAKKVRGFPKIVATLKDTVDYLKEHAELAKKIDPSKVTTMEAIVSELKELINQ